MTAFGEPIQATGTAASPGGTRYGYAGSWGYEEAECRVIDLNGPEPGGETTWCDPLAELGWLHVGHRYYDPASGRFVQRDPIGIGGGLNVYVYVLNLPVHRTDPCGLAYASMPWSWRDFGAACFAGAVVGALEGGVLGTSMGPAGTLAGTASGAIIGTASGGITYSAVWTWYVITDLWDLNLYYLEEIARQRKQREAHPEIWPPPKPVNPADAWMRVRCFVAGTILWTSQGPVSIEEVEVGDFILSHNADSGTQCFSVVTSIVPSSSQVLITVCWRGGEVSCTPEHPFWTAEQGWCCAGNLTRGMRLLDSHGSLTPIEDVVIENGGHSVPTYDLHVEPHNCYYVGDNPVLVHNKPV